MQLHWAPFNHSQGTRMTGSLPLTTAPPGCAIYVVAGPEYWDSIPIQHERLCRRIRVALHQHVRPSGASDYTFKMDAFEDALRTHRCVVREMLKGTSWIYELLLELR